ncbi:nucleotidyltransferase domain-containing protein [Thiohalorhabdus methylotrophus]|uniref:Nucleotidyltransferase domain-containing protein n=1 Tax=Thiohalorhabdus methylotrophus TaxID=3242694 RepID=A0ABV4TX93_9GAMM
MGDAPIATAPGAVIPQRVRSVARHAAQALRKELGMEARILWFSAWPRGEARTGAPIELAIESPSLLDTRALSRARERVEALDTLYSFNVVDLDQTEAARRERMQREGMEL